MLKPLFCLCAGALACTLMSACAGGSMTMPPVGSSTSSVQQMRPLDNLGEILKPKPHLAISSAAGSGSVIRQQAQDNLGEILHGKKSTVAQITKSTQARSVIGLDNLGEILKHK